MTAVFKHELKLYFHSLTAYVFGAFLLAFVGIGAMMYNIQAAVSNFEYVLSFCSIVFAVIVPVLTMRVIAEERKQKTDQLLYALPITTTQVVLGKYLALLAVYLIPLAIISLYPLIFAQFGEVYLPTSYGSMLAFFLLGAALLSVGVFISSLTENQGMAAGIGVAVILVNYYSVSLSELVSSTAAGSLVAMSVIVVILGFVVRHLTRNENLAYWPCLGAIAAMLVAYFVDSSLFEGLLPKIMSDYTVLGMTTPSESCVTILSPAGEPFMYYLDGSTILIEKKLIQHPHLKGRLNFTIAHEIAHQIIFHMFPDEYSLSYKAYCDYNFLLMVSILMALLDWLKQQKKIGSKSSLRIMIFLKISNVFSIVTSS